MPEKSFVAGAIRLLEHFKLEMGYSGVGEDESGADVEEAIVTLWRWKRTKPGDAAASMNVADQG